MLYTPVIKVFFFWILLCLKYFLMKICTCSRFSSLWSILILGNLWLSLFLLSNFNSLKIKRHSKKELKRENHSIQVFYTILVFFSFLSSWSLGGGGNLRLSSKLQILNKEAVSGSFNSLKTKRHSNKIL